MLISDAQLDALGRRDLSTVDTLIVHHSVFSPDADISEIDVMERAAQDFTVVGYHRYIKRVDAANDVWTAQTGRPDWAVPAAALGDNLTSYDICVAGNYQPGVEGVATNAISPNAMKVLEVAILVAKLKMPIRYLIGHRDVAALMAHKGFDPGAYSTDCPGSLLYARLHELRIATGLANRPELL